LDLLRCSTERKVGSTFSMI